MNPGEDFTGEVEFEFTRIALTLPPGVSFPQDGYGRLFIHNDGAASASTTIAFRVKGGALGGRVPGSYSMENSRLMIGGLIGGFQSVKLELSEMMPEGESDPLASKGVIFMNGEVVGMQDPYFSSTKSVPAQSGEAIEIALE